MEVNEGNINRMAEYLQQTLSPDAVVRKPAEDFLKSVEGNQNYPVLLLSLVSKEDGDMNIKVAGAITFKNYVKRNWKVYEDVPDKIHQTDRDAVKGLIVDLMLKSPLPVQKQLSAAIAIIGQEDFPAKWPNLVNDMVVKFQSGDFHIINGVLQTAHSIFEKYSVQFKSQKLWEEIKFVLDNFAGPFTDLFVATIGLAEQHATNKEALKVIFGSLVLISKIFYHLNYQDLPEFFEDNMQKWMPRFHSLLTLENSLLVTDDDEPGVLEELRSQICDNIGLYAHKYEDEFQPFMQQFVTAVWNLLLTTGLNNKYDLLVSNAIQFLASVADRPHYKNLFEDENVLSSIMYVKTMLDKYAQNPAANWKSKDAAMYLVTSLATKAKTAKHGITQTNELVNLTEFCNNHVIPELSNAANTNQFPILKADCVKFVIPAQRNFLPHTKDLLIAFDTAIKAGFSKPVWIEEEELAKLSPTIWGERDVFVMDPFSGAAYQKIINVPEYKCTVVGPRCLLSCLQSKTQLPQLPYPMYTAAMKGLVVTFSGFDKPEEDRLGLLVKMMAGNYSNSFRDGITHLVTSKVKSQKYELAVQKETPVMTKEWVEAVWKISCKESVAAVDQRFSIHQCPALLDVTVSMLPVSRDYEVAPRGPRLLNDRWEPSSDEEDEYACDNCPKIFESDKRDKFMKHLAEHFKEEISAFLPQPPQPSRCPICEKQFTRGFDLFIHYAIAHNVIKDYVRESSYRRRYRRKGIAGSKPY